MRSSRMILLLFCFYLPILLFYGGCEDEGKGNENSAKKEIFKLEGETQVTEGYLTVDWKPQSPGACHSKTIKRGLLLGKITFEGGIEKGNSVFLKANGQTLIKAGIGELKGGGTQTGDPLDQKVPVLRYQGRVSNSKVDARSAVVLLAPDQRCVYKVSFLILVES